jgi:hypothetical protein
MSVAKTLYGVVLAALAGFGNSAANAAAASHDQIFAHVKANGVAIYQKGVSNIIHPQTGTYCILPTSPALQAGVTTGVVAPNLTLDYGYTPMNWSRSASAAQIPICVPTSFIWWSTAITSRPGSTPPRTSRSSCRSTEQPLSV